VAGITRRDFLDGVALAISAGVAPRPVFGADAPSAAYPPALTGVRGQHDGAFEAAHTMAFDRRQYRVGGLPVEEEYDCIVVGAGISGLAAAHYYRKRFGVDARILIVDNHDEFGGHARRNEFRAGERLLIGYGGSESLQSPQANFSPNVQELMRELGVEIERFRAHFDQQLYPDLGLSRGSFFDRDRFGIDRLVTGDPTDWVADDIPRGRRNGRPLEAFIGDFPVSQGARRELLALYTSRRVDLSRLPDAAAREDYLSKISYTEFLRRDWGLSEEAIAYFDGRTRDFFALPPSLLPALDCGIYAYPGFSGISLPPAEEAAAELAEPYIYHFPDGNASIARLLVRKLIPAALPGKTMDDIVLAEARYEELDRPGNPVRIRLMSTVVRVINGDGIVEVGVIANADRSLHRLRARHVVLACFLVYSNVLVRDWRPWQRLGVHEIYGVSSFHSRVKLDYPVSMGGYRCPRDPAEPIVLHLVHVPTVPGIGDPRAEVRAARRLLLERRFADFETAIRRDLSRMLGPGGFDAERDILAVTVNRWSHGYSWGTNTLVDDWHDQERIVETARRPLGGVTIANSDAGWSAYAHVAIDEARRAVAELPAGQ
jgi:spermidine dehydrogenase